MKYLVGLVALVALAGCNSTSSASRDSNDSQAVAAVNDNDGVVCKLEKRVGSNMMTRVCRTAEERAAQQEAAREYMTRMQSGSMTTNADGM